MKRTILATLIVALCSGSVGVAPVQAQVDAKQAEESIELAIRYLERQQEANGGWTEWPGFEGGTVALCTLSLLSAGVPPEAPVIQKGLANLRKLKTTFVYVVSLQTMAFCAARSQDDLPLIRRNVLWLQEAQVSNGMWSYSSGSQGGGDNSNTQFALLALHDAERFHESIPKLIKDNTWTKALNHWRGSQNDDGSWGYRPGDGGTGSMTCAGISSLIITADKVSDRPGADQSQMHCCEHVERDNRLDRALNWLGQHFSVAHNPGNQGSFLLYYLYGLERAGRMTAQRLIGGHDWYREGAAHLVQKQDKLSGMWKGTGRDEGHANIATSLSLLFMAKGRRPILMSKLKHDPGNDWENHPEDIANLSAYVESKWKRDLSWQIVDPKQATVDDLLQSPILFINGEKSPLFEPDEVEKLRQYVERGGFIFAEACCSGKSFDEGFRALIKQMFPSADHPLEKLPPEHAVWRVEEVVPPEFVGELWGVNVSCRTSIIYSSRDLSCKWQHSSPRRMQKLGREALVEIMAANAIGRNVVAYATNRELKYKFADWGQKNENNVEDRFPRGQMHIAQVIHSGGSDAAPGALPNLRRALAQVKNIRVNFERHEFTLADDKIFDFPVLFMHGRNAFTLSDEDREHLRQFVERGGVLLCDSICGNEDFSRSFRREMKIAFPESELERIPIDHPLFSTKFGGSSVKIVRRREPERVAADQPLKTLERRLEPQLEGIKRGDRYCVVFSPYDISCALENHSSPECRGYVHEDALKLGVNVVLYSLYQPGP